MIRTEETNNVPLPWATLDVEQRLAFRGGRHTRVNGLLSLLIACGLTVAFYGCLLLLRSNYFAEMLTDRGPTPYFIVLLTNWSLVILGLKWRKLSLQQKSLAFDVVPTDLDFVLSAATVDTVIQNIYNTVDDPKHFVLFHRIALALSNLRNIGRISDVDDMLRTQAAHDESAMETSYALVQGFVWAIPVLGFIGTVLGLSSAIGGFGSLLASTEEISQLADGLRGVTGGLQTAFETTLVALVAALIVQLLMTALKKSEEEFLDACTDYCTRHVVSRLRIMPYEAEADAT